MTTRISILLQLILVMMLFGGGSRAQQSTSLANEIQSIISRPEFRHARFGIEFYSLESQRPIYSLNTEELFLAASTTKVVTEGAALEALGSDYRFHTRVYRTGPVDADGTLSGKLVLVASGDPNLSARVQPDDTLSFENVDHINADEPGARPVPGDPLRVIRNLAQEVFRKGIRQISEGVTVDTSMFSVAFGREDPALSPIVINDNIIDLLVYSGSHEGEAAIISPSPKTGYAHFISRVVTTKAEMRPSIRISADVVSADGNHVVTITGTVPAGHGPQLFAYSVPDPRRFAEFAFVEALRDVGISSELLSSEKAHSFAETKASYATENMVAEHVSPPFSEEVKVTLKVSQNLHAELTPYLVGAIEGHRNDAKQAGFNNEREFLERAGLDLNAACSSSGAGSQSFFTPDFMVRYLVYMTKQKTYDKFFEALPVLGHDGTLFDVALSNPAAGHVHAKTGTDGQVNDLSGNYLVTSKALAGYITTANSEHLVFAIYINNAPVPKSGLDVLNLGKTAGEIAAAAYSHPSAHNRDGSD